MMRSFSKFVILGGLLLALLASGGCAGSRGQGHMFSFVADSFPADQAATLAERMADSLSEIFPPGHTTVFIHPASGRDSLGAAFEGSLRSRGFIIAPELPNRLWPSLMPWTKLMNRPGTPASPYPAGWS